MQTPIRGDTVLHLEFKEPLKSFESIWTYALYGSRVYVGANGGIIKDYTE